MGPSIFIDGEARIRERMGKRDTIASMGPSIFIDGESAS